MTSAATAVKASEPLASSRHRTVALAIGLIATTWFTLLSGWLGVTPGSVLVKRPNVIFSSDTSAWIERFAGDAKLPKAFPYAYIHPLEEVIWRPLTRTLYHVTKLFLPSEYARLLAARLLVAIVEGAGVGFLALLALRNEVTKLKLVVLFLTYLLFTANAAATLPEHWGITNGLLSITFVAPLLMTSLQSKTLFLLAMVAVAGGTIWTNTVFPALSLIHYSFPKRLKIAVVVALFLAGVGITILLYSRSYSIHWYVNKYLNVRLVRHPSQAITYAVLAMVFPAVGTAPHVLRYPGFDQVTYEPWGFASYFRIQAVGAFAWLTLFLGCSFRALKDDRTRPCAWLLGLWLLFSVVLHNIWGDEFLLYSPNWSWALMGLVVLGARHFSRTVIVAIAIPVIACQIYTLFAIKSALQTITQ